MMELEGMRKRAHVLELARLMVRAESQEHRLALLKIIQVCQLSVYKHLIQKLIGACY